MAEVRLFVCIFRTTIVALVGLVSLPVSVGAQNLPFSLFERSIEQLRQEAGIPALSAVILQNRQIVWEQNLGMADVERSLAATGNTPYPVADLTQTFAAVLLLQRIDRGDFELRDRMQRWTTAIPEQSATVEQVLRHTTTGSFRYDPERFASLGTVIEYYTRQPIRRAMAEQILDRLAMRDSVPGLDIGQAADASLFDQDDLQRYSSVLQRVAVPYRVDVQRKATRSEYPPRTMNAKSGLVASARDLARFDAALDDTGLLLSQPAAAAMRERDASAPTGLGWFVQSYNSDKIIWHFGNVPNAFSSLIIKVPQRQLTLILLANSDGLSAPFGLDQGDVTKSLYARAFLRTFLP